MARRPRVNEARLGSTSLQPKDCLTLFNAALGVVAIYFGINELAFLALGAVLAAAIADFLDGRVARMLGGGNELGKQLDSLADLVSFGVAPVVACLGQSNGFATLACGMVFVMAGVVRLARFNLQEEKGVFFGLPIPIAGIVACAMAVWLPGFAWLGLLALGILMVAPFRLEKP